MPVKSKSKSTPSQKKADAPPPPKWPVLEPLLPSTDLALETVLEDQIILIRRFFTSSLCKKYVTFLASLPLTTTPGIPKKGEALRVNDRFQIEDHHFAEQLWHDTGLKDLVLGDSTAGNDDRSRAARGAWGGAVCGLNPRIRIYRYSKGQFFDQHCKFISSISSRPFSYALQY